VPIVDDIRTQSFGVCTSKAQASQCKTLIGRTSCEAVVGCEFVVNQKCTSEKLIPSELDPHVIEFTSTDDKAQTITFD
jgi:hypothetical protein